MIFQINKGNKSFSSNDILIDVNFEVKNTEKIAIVGKNGCGKTTLLKCIAGIEYLDSGSIFSKRDISISFLRQTAISDEDISVKEELNKVFEKVLELKSIIDDLEIQMKNDHSKEILEKYSNYILEFEALNGWNFSSERNMVFCKFGFELSDLDRKINTFSGGQKTKIAFVKILLSKPDILILDEPTNHLDITTITWLEDYLKAYSKAIICVSHDRMFIDKVADVIYDLEYGILTKYIGNYSNFKIQKENNILLQTQAYNRQQKEIDRLNVLIEKFRYKKNKASFAQSKIKYLERMEKLEKPTLADEKKIKLLFKSKVKGGKKVLIVDKLKIGYDKPLAEFSFELLRGDKLAILGSNGSGKSTLIKTLMEILKPISGEFLFGHQIEIAYFDQQNAIFDSDKTVLDELWDEYPDSDITSIRTVLGRFLFSSDDVFKSVRVLSGGERVRLALAKLMLKKANLLILDEPLNHLDILSKEALESALREFDGTIIMVSHDRYFIKQLSTYTIEIINGNVFYNVEETMNFTEEKEVKKVKVTNKNVSSNNRIKKIEAEIDELEKKLKESNKHLFLPEYYNDYIKLRDLELEIKSLNERLESLMSEWELLSIEK